jgi:hypothetical protein
MGRRPIGETAMTAAERQQRRRRRLNNYFPHRLPWDDNTQADLAQTKFMHELYRWMEDGDTKQVASWLAFGIRDAERWEELDALVREEFQAKLESRIP